MSDLHQAALIFPAKSRSINPYLGLKAVKNNRFLSVAEGVLLNLKFPLVRAQFMQLRFRGERRQN